MSVMATFTPPFQPDFGTKHEQKPMTLKAVFGDGYTQRAADGLNNRMYNLNLAWTNLIQADKDTIINFFKARKGIDAFKFTYQDETTPNAYVCGEWGYTHSDYYGYTVTATFRQVYDTQWLPSSLGAKLQLWLRGDLLTGTAGSSIATWSDSSGLGNNATGPATHQPTLVLSGLNGMNTVALAAASTQYFTLPNYLSTRTSAAAFAVYSLTASPPATVPAAGPVFGDFGTGSLSNHDPYTDGSFYENYCSSTRTTVSGIAASTAFRILTLRSRADKWQLGINGTNYSDLTTNAFSVNTAPKIGLSSIAGAYLGGQIAEIVDCNDYLTTDEKNKVEGYLAWKWGLQGSLPSSHVYYNARP